MLRSEILQKLHKKHKNLSEEDIELLFNIFIKKISSSLKKGKNIEIRGFGTFSRKINREKMFFPKSKSGHYKMSTLHFSSNIGLGPGPLADP